MAEGKYLIDAEAGERLLRMKLIGLWTVDDLRSFDDARTSRLRALGWSSGSFVSLLDLRQHGVQSQAVTAQARANFQEKPIVPRRHAIVIASALNRLQAKRLAAPVNERLFDDEAGALAWLREAHAA